MKPNKNNFFENDIYIGNGSHVSIGKNCHINEHVFIQAATIGDYVMIAPNVSILSKSHNYDKLEVPMIQQGETDHSPVNIKNNVWIGRVAIILPGVTIEEGCIVAAGAVVTKTTNPFTIVGGIPAKTIKKRS